MNNLPAPDNHPCGKRQFMRSDGRIEKRAIIRVPVRLVPVGNGFLAETATIVNMNRHGAGVLTSRRWRPGERLVVTSLPGEFRRPGKVIHCYPLADGQFCVGLEFGAGVKEWRDAPWARVAG